jgi:hypothetical protein
MNCAVEIRLGAMIPSFIKTDLGIQKLIGGNFNRHTRTHT